MKAAVNLSKDISRIVITSLKNTAGITLRQNTTASSKNGLIEVTQIINTVCTLTCSRYTTSDSNLIELSCCARTLIKDTVTFVCASLDTSCRRDCNRSPARTSIIGINAVSSTARRFTRCCDAQGASALVCRKNAILTARRGGRVNRERGASRLYRYAKMPSRSTRRRTRCCDAQGAGAVVSRINAILPPVVVAALIVRDVP